MLSLQSFVVWSAVLITIDGHQNSVHALRQISNIFYLNVPATVCGPLEGRVGLAVIWSNKLKVYVDFNKGRTVFSVFFFAMRITYDNRIGESHNPLLLNSQTHSVNDSIYGFD